MVKARYRKIGRGWVRVIVFLAFSLFFLVKSVRIYALRLCWGWGSVSHLVHLGRWSIENGVWGSSSRKFRGSLRSHKFFETRIFFPFLFKSAYTFGVFRPFNWKWKWEHWRLEFNIKYYNKCYNLSNASLTSLIKEFSIRGYL